MPAGGYHPEAYPWMQVKPENRAQRVRERLAVQDVGALLALLRFDGERRGVGAATLKTYSAGVRAFLAWAWRTGRDILQPDADLALDFTRDLTRAGRSPGTVMTYRPAVAALYRALRWAGATVADPMRDAPRVKDPVPRHEKRQAYSEGELRRLLAAASWDDRLLLLLAGVVGLRNSELRAARWEHVDWEKGALRVQGKGGRVRRAVMNRAVMEALRITQAQVAQDGRRHRAEFILPWGDPDTLRLRLKKLCEQVGVPYAGRALHGARHTAGTMVYQRTRNLDDVARQLGHSQIETSRVYADHDDRATRDALDSVDVD